MRNRYILNSRLRRKFGVKRYPAGASLWRDVSKDLVVRGAQKLRLECGARPAR